MVMMIMSATEAGKGDRSFNGILLGGLSSELVVLGASLLVLGASFLVLGARLQELSLTRGELSIDCVAILQVLVPVV